MSHMNQNEMAAASPAGFSTVRDNQRLSPATKSQAASRQLMNLSFSKILLLFVVGSIVGLGIEIIYHFIVYGGYESRVGLVWGPFSPLYGVGAVIMTLILNYLYRFNGVVIFIASMLIGSTVEFIASFGMEHLFGAVAWDYSGTFMNIQGRVNLMFALMWGVLGLAWVRLVMPLMSKGFNAINWKQPLVKLGTVALAVFMTVNIVVTVQALDRESRRADGLPALTQVDHFLDEHFPTEVMTATFENMSIYGTSEDNQ